MAFAGFPKNTFDFLAGLTKHNDKVWFDNHRKEYEQYYVAPALEFVTALGPRLQRISSTVRFEPRINGSLFRVNRDIRFSKDKTPYKNHIDLWFWEGDRRGWDSPGFFFRMFADRVMLGAGMHDFQKPMLERYRKAVVDEERGAALLKVLAQVKRRGYVVGGATRRRVPRGFAAEHPRAELLLQDGLHAGLEQRIPKEAKSAAFVTWCAEHYENVHPISAWLASIA